MTPLAEGGWVHTRLAFLRTRMSSNLSESEDFGGQQAPKRQQWDAGDSEIGGVGQKETGESGAN